MLLEYKRLSLRVDQSGSDLFLKEQIGYTTKTQVLIRKVDGLQPHSKLTADWYFDAVKHYSIEIAFEDGRTPPNFEYLNKVDSSFRVVF